MAPAARRPRPLARRGHGDPIPSDDDEPRNAIADLLREAERRLGGNDSDGAMAQVRKALETIETTSGWNWPGQKDKKDRTVAERWAWILSALEDQGQRSPPRRRRHENPHLHRAEAETLIRLTAALLGIVP